MHKSKSFYICMSIFATVVIAVVCVAVHLSDKPQRDSIIEQAKLERDARMNERLSRPYGKIEIPAEVYVDLIDSENPGKPVEIVISTATEMPVNMARIILSKSKTGPEPEQDETLWTDMSGGVVDKTIIYNAGNLSVGKHQFNVAMEFLPPGENSKVLLAVGSLFLDVRATKILYSNVSFDQIERLELHRELQKRVLVSMMPELKNANMKMLAQESAAIEEANPGAVDEKIQELIASDPEVAKRVEEINSNTEEPVYSSGSLLMSNQSQSDVTGMGGNYKPISDVEVPVPAEFRN